MLVPHDPIMTIYRYSHFFKIVQINPRAYGAIYDLCSRYVLYGFVKEKGQKPERKPVKVFATRTKNNLEYRFHIGLFQEFMMLTRKHYITPDMFDVIDVPLYQPQKINVSLKKGWTLRDYQEQGRDFIVNSDPTDNHSRLITLGTGLGKTVTALSAIGELKTRTLIIVLPSYIEKWAGDVTNSLDCKAKDIMVVQGSSQLKGVIGLAKDKELTSKFVIISLITLRNFFNTYEDRNGDVESDGYPCNPDELCEVLGIGNIIIDESHQHLHAVYKLMMYLHVPKIIALSATFVSDEYVVAKIQKVMFPFEIRFEGVKMEKYIGVYALSYYINDFKNQKINTKQYGNNAYSHVEFEKSIIRNKKLLSNYLKLIDYLVQTFYLEDYKTKDKLRIYAASINMCTIITNYLKEKYPKFSVKRYVEADAYENIIEPDIAVTTILSAGTAIDIPDLRVVIMTNCIQSVVSNLQSIGRLRKLKDRDVKFIYTYSNDIKRQCDYHEQRKIIFEDRAAFIKEFTCPISL